MNEKTLTIHSDRAALLEALNTMPDEAFSWVIEWAAGDTGTPIAFPDGLGGFMDDSRTAILALQAAARDYRKKNLSLASLRNRTP